MRIEDNGIKGEDSVLNDKVEYCVNFALHISHQLRNPLSVLINVINQLSRQIGDDGNKRELIMMLEEEIYSIKVLSDELSLFGHCISKEVCRLRLGPFLRDLRNNFLKEYPFLNEDFLTVICKDDTLTIVTNPQHLASIIEAVIFTMFRKRQNRGRVRITARRNGQRPVIECEYLGMIYHLPGENRFEDIITKKTGRNADFALCLMDYCVRAKGWKMHLEPGTGKTTSVVIEFPSPAEENLAGG